MTTIQEVHEAQQLINKCGQLKKEIRELTFAVESPLGIFGEVKYYLNEEKKSVSAERFQIEGAATPKIIALIIAQLEEDMKTACLRLIELGVEEPEDG